jgi:hypothetical protein
MEQLAREEARADSSNEPTTIISIAGRQYFVHHFPASFDPFLL